MGTSLPPAAGAALPISPLSLVVVAYGKHYLVRNLVRSLCEHPDCALIRELVVVDNGYPMMGDCRDHFSPGPLPFALRFVQHHGQNYSSSVNLGVRETTAPVLILANSDIEWLPGHSLAPALAELERDPRIGIAGPQLVFPSGRWQRSAGPFPSLPEVLGSFLLLGSVENRFASARLERRHGGMPHEVDFVDGACLLVRRECFESLGGYDPSFDFAASEADFNWRAKAAHWRRVLVPAARVMHIRGASSTADEPDHYAERLFAAKRQLVERIGGRWRANWYDALQRVAAVEHAVIYSALATIWPSDEARRRARLSKARARAAFSRAHTSVASTYMLEGTEE